MARQEFRQSVKIEIRLRATRDNVVYCEICGLPAKKWHIDHIKATALEVDKSKPLTAADGQLLCAGSRFSCHGIKTAEEDVPAIAEAKRRQALHLGVEPKTQNPIKQRPKAEKTPPRPAAAGMSEIARRFGLQ
jgi:hypothetical protein